MNGSSRLKEHLTNLLNALTNLSPSRNLISQFILLLPKDLTIVEHSYPELTTAAAKEILQLLGIKFGDQVQRGKGLAEALYQHIHKTFDWLDNELVYRKPGEEVKKLDVRSELAKLLDTDQRSLPNPYMEWAKLVLRKLSNEQLGRKAINFMRMLLSRESIEIYDSNKFNMREPSQWDTFKKEVTEKLKVNPAEFEELCRLTIGDPKLGSEELYYTGSRRYMESQAVLDHSEYHLDFVYKHSRYLYYGSYYGGRSVTVHYAFRHKETLKKLLEGFEG